MANKKRPRPIHLTNRTAIGLRKSAQRVRGAWLVAMGVVTMIFTVLAVYLGFSWLPAVPLTLMLGVVVIVLMMIVSRSQYLMLISQAICTEAASRQMEESRIEKQRRDKAIEELAAMHADVREAQKKGVLDSAFSGDESLLFDLLTGRQESEEEILKKRRTEEDEELYAASYSAQEQPDDEEDLYPPKKAKYSAEFVSSASTGNTRSAMKAVKEKEKEEETDTDDKPDGEETGARRRRRRSPSAATAPLQLIRNDQAQ